MGVCAMDIEKIKRENEIVSRRKHITDNGSTTVEMCIIMPVLLGLIVLTTGIFISLYVDIEIFSKSYTQLYTYYQPNMNELEMKSDLEEELVKHYDGKVDVLTVYTCTENGVIEVKLKSFDSGPEGLYVYGGGEFSYNLEYDKCTSRLRRWQLLGDIVCE